MFALQINIIKLLSNLFSFTSHKEWITEQFIINCCPQNSQPRKVYMLTVDEAEPGMY
jgi:hypothetical protein